MQLLKTQRQKPFLQSVQGLILACVSVVMTGCGGGALLEAGSTTATTTGPTTFIGLTSASLQVGVASVLNITGTNLPLTATVTLAKGTCAAPTANTASGFSIVCTPGAVTGESATIMSDALSAGGWWIGQQELTVTAAASSLPMNDTGITSVQCFQSGSNTLVSCTAAAAISLNDKQDGMVGRDVSFPDQLDGLYGSSLAYPGAVTDCVKDLVTGLTWQRASTTLTSVLPTGYRDESIQLATDANTSVLCGLTNWRVPTRLELQGMVLFSAPFAVGATNMDWFPLTKPTWYYSGSIYRPNSANNAWLVDFAQGKTSVMTGAGATSIEVRLVSGDVVAPVARFTPSSNGTEVTDTLTGLIWRRCSEGQAWNGSTCAGPRGAFTHEEALMQAKSQNTWRLPNVKELSSLTDDTLYSPSIDTTIFAAAPAGAFWTSTPVVILGNPRSDQVWSVDFLDGSVAPLTRSTSTGFVRLVR